jgi:hypothetical protein
MGLAALKSSATYEDLLAVPDHLVAEILNGDLRTGISAPRVAHQSDCADAGSAAARRGALGAAAAHDGSDMVKAAPFEAVDLDLGALWSGASEPAP